MKMKLKFVDHGSCNFEELEDLLSAISKITDHQWYAWDYRNEPTIPFIFMQNHIPPTDFEKIFYFKQPKWLEDVVLPLGNKLAEQFNGKILKLMLIAVEPEAINGNYHIDPSDTLRLVHRFHMPLIQSELTRYHVDGEEFAMQVGHWYEKDNTLTHAVVNYANPRERRVSLQCDVFPLDDSRFIKFPEYY